MESGSQAHDEGLAYVHSFDPNITGDAIFIETYTMISAASIEPLVIEVIQLQMQHLFYEEHRHVLRDLPPECRKYGFTVKSSAFSTEHD